MPLNSQMKDVDLILMNMNNKKSVSIQVKWSKAFEPGKKDTEKYWDGSLGWFFLKKDTIQEATSDYFVFLVYVIHQSIKTGRRTIKPHTLTIPTDILKTLCLKHKTPHPDRYSFYFWINPTRKTACDIREKDEENRYDVSDYLDVKGIKQMNDILK